MSATPAELKFEEKAVPLWRYQQLDQLSKHHLKNRARNLEDSVGKSRLPLRVAQDSESLICWIINVMLSEAVGTPISHSEFGLPKALLARREGQDMPSPVPDMAPPTDRGELGDSQGSYLESRAAALASKERARGSGIF